MKIAAIATAVMTAASTVAAWWHLLHIRCVDSFVVYVYDTCYNESCWMKAALKAAAIMTSAFITATLMTVQNENWICSAALMTGLL